MNNKKTKIISGYQYFFKYVFFVSMASFVFIGNLIIMLIKESGFFSDRFGYIYTERGFVYIDGVNTGAFEIGLPIGILITLLLAIKQHKKYQSFKAKNGD